MEDRTRLGQHLLIKCPKLCFKHCVEKRFNTLQSTVIKDSLSLSWKVDEARAFHTVLLIYALGKYTHCDWTIRCCISKPKRSLTWLKWRFWRDSSLLFNAYTELWSPEDTYHTLSNRASLISAFIGDGQPKLHHPQPLAWLLARDKQPLRDSMSA